VGRPGFLILQATAFVQCYMSRADNPIPRIAENVSRHADDSLHVPAAPKSHLSDL
jgi:hypothetical protein